MPVRGMELPPPGNWQCKKVKELLAALRQIPIGHMVEIEGATQGYIKTTANRYGISIETRKRMNGSVGVWRTQPTPTPIP